MHLRNGCTGNRNGIELVEYLIGGFAVNALKGGQRHLARKRRHLILKLG